MNKIQFAANMDTNYVFHMLSVSKCGYDNAYGDYYAPLYPHEDLAVLKMHEELITVCGGQHCGALYGIIVCDAACAKSSAKDYYSELIHQATNNDIPNAISEHSETICQIAAVMIKHYDHFVENIWIREQVKISEYIPTVQHFFDETNFTEKAEAAVGNKLPHDFFTATLVASVENGAEAIDISDEQDVFGIERTPLDAFYFIGHEFIIYLLFDTLKEENAFKELNTWNITEGLAEYYLKQILGDTRFFNTHKIYVAFFEQANKQKHLNAVELYRKGLEVFP
ncbi:MAG: hypothetical protein IJ448_04970 [Oscillospiraceae bacterium]|nr:hypothetical protein [Oscillospiraceae bacterium]